MNAERLLALYDRVCEAPDAIPRLRRFILDLAVRGKLVEQDSNDEPIFEYLLRIAKGNIKLLPEVEADNGESYVGPVSDEDPFDLPTGWKWVRLGTVGTVASSSRVHKKDWSGAGVPFFRAREIVKLSEAGKVENELFISEELYLALSKHGHVPETGDIMITGVGTIGVPYVVTSQDRFYFKDASVLIFKNRLNLDPRFLYYLMKSPYWVTQVHSESMGTTVHTLTIRRAKESLVPLPPRAEQHRIVAKVDELMALCDSLEAEREKREATRDRLTTVSLGRLTAPDFDEKQFKAHADFAIKMLPELTTRPDQIKAMRQTILDLAVRGKLVEQNQDDESGSALLIRLQRGRNAKRKAIQGDTNEEAQLLPSLPDSWTWTTIDQIAAAEENAITDGPFGAKLKTAHYVSESGCRVIRLQNIGHGVFRDEHRSFIDREHFDSLSKHHVKPGDLVVAGLVDSGVRCAEVPTSIGRALVKADCYRLAVHPELCARFFLHYLNSPLARDFASAHHHGMTLTRIGLGNFRKLAVPLPPASEQIRIVAKVGGLMAFCDDLEHALTAGEDSRGRLLEALLVEGLEPAARWAA